MRIKYIITDGKWTGKNGDDTTAVGPFIRKEAFDPLSLIISKATKLTEIGRAILSYIVNS